MTDLPELDNVDENIIALLQSNGRLSNRAVARELGLSEATIRKRLKRLIEGGAIMYGLIVDVGATGMAVSGWLRIEAQPRYLREVAKSVSGREGCSFCCLVNGKASIRAYLFEKDLADMAKTVETISQQTGVIRVEARETISVPHQRPELMLAADKPPRECWKLG